MKVVLYYILDILYLCIVTMKRYGYVTPEKTCSMHTVRVKAYTIMLWKPGRKVKVTVNFTQEQASDASWGRVVNATPRPLFPGESDPVPIL
jgi:hypothetical protein